MARQNVVRDFDYYIGSYLFDCQSRRLSPKTMGSYEQALRLFERWAEKEAQIKTPLEITEAIVRQYICDLQERGKYSFYANEEREAVNCPDRRRDYRAPVSVTTINNYIRNLRAFFNWLEAEPGARGNPMAKITQLKTERKAREYLEDYEVKRLLHSFDKSYYSKHRDMTVITLLLDTGMRLGECLGLTATHVDLTEKVINLTPDLTKGRKPRSVFFSTRTARLLTSWLRFKDRYVESEYLFPAKAAAEPVSIHTFETNFKKYVHRAGIKKELTPHALGNNFAKRCLLAGMDSYTLSRILGHSSVTITERAYLDLTDKDLRRCYERFSPMGRLGIL